MVDLFEIWVAKYESFALTASGPYCAPAKGPRENWLPCHASGAPEKLNYKAFVTAGMGLLC